MLKSSQSWLNDIPLDDPLERRQAGLLQIMLLVIIVGGLLGLPIGILTAAEDTPPILPLVAYPLLIVCTIAAFILLRRGRLTASINMATVGLILAIGISLIAAGFGDSQVILISFTIPVALGGLMAGRRGLLFAAGLSVAFVIITAVLETFAPALVGFLRLPNRSPLAITATFILLIGVLSLFLDRFGSSLRDALIAAQTREQELERLRASLEATVAERTASLQQALEDVEQREGRLAQTLADLRASELVVRELSAPVIPVLPGVLVAPLIGALDSERADVLTDNVLGMVERERARQVIFDITGVPIVDTQVARVLLQTASAVRLLGAQTSLVGIRPEVAQTIILLGADFSDIATYPDLREAVEAILNRRDRGESNNVRRTV